MRICTKSVKSLFSDKVMMQRKETVATHSTLLVMVLRIHYQKILFDHIQHRTNMDTKILQVLKPETATGGVL